MIFCPVRDKTKMENYYFLSIYIPYEKFKQFIKIVSDFKYFTHHYLVF